MIEKVLLKRSDALVNGEPKLPTSENMLHGELAINYKKDHETISTLNDNDEIATFSSDKQVKTWISGVTSGFTTLSSFNTHTGDTTAHVTSNEKSTWNGKQDAIEDLQTIRDNASAGASKVSNVQADWDATTGLAVILNKPTIPSVENYFDDVEYDSDTKRINFKNGNTVKDYIDATDFIKDGMISSVTITGRSMVITFNTDAGHENITLSLDDIFDPDNYYTSQEVDEKYFVNSAQTKSQIESYNYLTGFTETQLSTGNTSGTGNVVTNISVSNHEITMTKGITVPDWATASTKPSYTASEVGALPTGTTLDNVGDGTTRKLSDYATVSNLNAHTGNTGIHLPSVTASDNGKILQVVNGVWTLVTPITVYSGSETPSNSLGNNGDIYIQV